MTPTLPPFIDEATFEKIVTETSEEAWNNLQDSSHTTVVLWYESDECQLDISCSIFGRKRISGNGIDTPETVEIHDVKVTPRIVYTEPDLSPDFRQHLLRRIKNEIEDYLITT